MAIVDISEEAGFRAINEIVKIFGENKATFIKADVTKKTELEAVFETTIKTYNQLDIVINNAGKVDEFDWKSTVELNLVSQLCQKTSTKDLKFRLLLSKVLISL